MRLTAFVLALLGAASGAAAQTAVARPATGAPLMFEVTLRRYAADNRTVASAGDSGTAGNKFESYVWTSASLCGMGASNIEPGTVPGVGWHFTGEVLSTAVNQMSVRVEWQRVWDKGVRLQDGPNGSQAITLRSGERIELDRVLPAGPSPCGAVDARLEAAVVTRPAYRLTIASGGSTAAGLGYIMPPIRLKKPYFFVSRLGTYDAELWLVHRKPDGTETVQQQTVRFGGVVGLVATYTFPPIEVPTSRGLITLDITGKLQAFVGDPPDPDQPANRAFVVLRSVTPAVGADAPLAERIMLSISRRARASGAPLLDVTGGTSMAVDISAPTDVLSFEFPALQKAAEDLLKGHQFSLRLRVTPVAK